MLRSRKEVAAFSTPASALNDTSEDALFNLAWERIVALSQLGTGSIEIKSGYGLTVEGELKMLRVIKRLKQKSKLEIRSTFLGAHTYPPEFKNHHDGYIKLITEQMLPVIASKSSLITLMCFANRISFRRKKLRSFARQEWRMGCSPNYM